MNLIPQRWLLEQVQADSENNFGYSDLMQDFMATCNNLLRPKPLFCLSNPSPNAKKMGNI